MSEDEDKLALKSVFLKSCYEGNEDKVKACITLEVNVNCIGLTREEDYQNENEGRIWKSSPGIYKAAVHNWIKIVEMLLGQPDINVNKTDDTDNTTLHAACWQRTSRTQIIKALCNEPKIKLNLKDKLGRTPAFRAVANGHVSNLKALKNFTGVDWNTKNNQGYSPLMWAVKEEYTEEVAELLSIPSIDIETTNSSGETIYQVARYDYGILILVNILVFRSNNSTEILRLLPGTAENENETLCLEVKRLQLKEKRFASIIPECKVN